MSTSGSPIQALFEDPKIKEIRDAVAQKNDAIPFLLLPVRLETRFKKVEKKGMDKPTGVESILETLGAIHVQAIDVLQKPNAINLRSLITSLTSLTASIDKNGVMLIKEKGWLKQLFSDLKKDIDKIISISVTGFAAEAAQLQKAMNAAEKAITGLQVQDDITLQKAKDFIYQMETVLAALQGLTGPRKSIPYLNIKNKKDLYNYILSSLDNTLNLYLTAKSAVSQIKFIAGAQVNRIIELHAEIKRILPSMAGKILEINKERNGKQDKAWIAFSNTAVMEKITSIQTAGASFDPEMISIIRAIPNPPLMETGELLTHGIQTLVKLKKFNTDKKEGYEKNKRFKKYIEPRINTLLAIIKNPIEESKPGQARVLQNMYTTLSASINTSASIIKNQAAKNTSQKFGLKTINTFLSAKAIPALSAFAASTQTKPSAKVVINTKQPEIQNQLWVRIYPDDIFVDTHEESLTLNEETSGKQFWKMWWTASLDKDLEMAAWTTLCKALGTKRASWVARQLKPDPLKPQNTDALKNRPSAKTTDSIQLLNTSYEQLKKFAYEKSALEILQLPATAVSLQSIVANYTKIISLINTLAEEQDYLIEKLKSSFIQATSYINQLIEKSRQLKPDEIALCTNSLVALQKTVTLLDQLQLLIIKLPATPQKAFMDKQGEPFIYPAVAIKSKDWSKAPHCLCMPDKFAVITVKDNEFQHIQTGNAIPDNLPVGMNPDKFENADTYTIDSNGDLTMDEDLKWMTDYNEAVKKGMAITLDITQDQFDKGFDKVIVIGVKNTDAKVSKALIEDLFNNHMYAPDGMNFLKVATPTNNTQYRKSGYDPDDDIQQRYDIEIAGKKFNTAPADPYVAADGKKLCEALGIDDAVMQYANDATQTEIGNALLMNRALWNGTLGHCMEEMFDSIFTYDNIRRTETLFTGHCIGRGSLPSVRVGVQPYGILPTTAFSRLQLYAGTPPLTRQEIINAATNKILNVLVNTKLQQRFELRLQELLQLLYKEFSDLGRQHVINYSNLNKNGNSSAGFIEMLCLHPVSLNYTYRQSINIARGPNATEDLISGNFKADDSFGPNGVYATFRDLMLKGVFYPSFEFADESSPNTDAKKQEDSRYSRIQHQFVTSRNYGNRFLALTPDLKGPVADTQPLSFTDPISDSISRPDGSRINYMQWLLENYADTILGGNAIAGLPYKSLLFLMLRQALLQAYQEAALNILQAENMLTEEKRRATGSRYFYHFRIWDPVAKKYYHQYITKWHLLFKHVDVLPALLNNPAFSTFPFYTYILNQNFKSIAHYLDQLIKIPLDTLTPDLSVIKMFSPLHKVHFQKVHTVRYAIKQLEKLPGAELEILLGEHVDLSTHRLDAWMLSLVNQRLQNQRQKQAKGLFIGAYGYVENLRPDDNKKLYGNAVLKDFKLPAEKPVYKDPDNQGFIHAASIGQAITAAVLRSAYSTNTTEDAPNRLAVNLSSARVRMALNLIAGLRNGQSVGALLGFQFERGLHERYLEAELDKFIQPFRKAFPLKQQVEETAGSNKATYESLTVDGNALLQLVYDSLNWFALKSEKTIGDLLKENNFSKLPAPIKLIIDTAVQAGDDKNKIYTVICEEMDRMADALDALGDLATSESVYQIVKGNYVRAAAVMDALAQGKNIPDPQVIETYRSGTVLTHRIFFNLPTFIIGGINTFKPPPGWAFPATSRASAEPSLNYWLGMALGAAISYKCVVTLTDPLNIQTKTDFELSELNWQPIDLFHLNGGENDLVNIITLHFINKKIAETKVSVNFNERGSLWSAADKTISELFYFLKTLQNLFGSSRYAGASDLMQPDKVQDSGNTGKHNMTDLSSRVNAAVTDLSNFNNAVKGEVFVAAVLSGTTAADKVLLSAADYLKMVAYLNRAALLGISSATTSPFVIKKDGTEHYYTVFNQLLSAYKEAQARQDLALSLQTALGAIVRPSLKAEKSAELAKVIFGKNMILIPTYTLDNAIALNTQLQLPAASKISRNGSPLALEDWLQSVSRVRARMKDLQQYFQTSDMFETALPAMQPVQLPYELNDYWLGMEYPSDYAPKSDKLSLMLVNHSLMTSQSLQSGLIIDEWLEIIPGQQETSGIVFNYNQPNATPPQSILLAVTPNVTNEWEWDDLVHTVIDTLDLSKIRAVEPDHLDASYLSHLMHGVVSEIPPPQVTGEDPNALGVQAVMDFSVIK